MPRSYKTAEDKLDCSVPSSFFSSVSFLLRGDARASNTPATAAMAIIPPMNPHTFILMPLLYHDRSRRSILMLFIGFFNFPPAANSQSHKLHAFAKSLERLIMHSRRRAHEKERSVHYCSHALIKGTIEVR